MMSTFDIVEFQRGVKQHLLSEEPRFRQLIADRDLSE